MATADIELHLPGNGVWQILATLRPAAHLLRKLRKQSAESESTCSMLPPDAPGKEKRVMNQL